MITGRRYTLADRGWLTAALLLVAVLVPTAVILWLMNEAVTSQTTAARQSVVEAYRTQLRFVSQQINAFWQTRATDLDRLAPYGSPSEFESLVSGGTVDAVIFLDGGSGGGTAAASPARAVPSSTRRRDDVRVIEARDRIRGLVRAGNRAGALSLIEQHFLAPDAALGFDPDGRLVNAHEHLLALTLMGAGDPRRTMVIDRFTRMLNDYDTVVMPPSQRLFLMSELRAIAPAVELPTHDAEGMAADFLDVEVPRPDLSGLRATLVPGVWQLASRNGRMIALYREETVHAAQHHFVDAYQSDMVRFAIFPPAEEAYEEAIAVGAALPGWQASFMLLDVAALDQSAHARAASYLWIGLLGIGVFSIVAIGAAHSFRRQLHLTRLKTDLVAAVSHELRTPLASMRLLVDGLLQDQTVDPVKTREYLNLIAAENARLSRLIDNFLTFSRLERNRHQFSFAAISPAEVVQGTVDAMRDRLHPGCEIDVTTAANLPPVRADADALVTALLNLLDNAYKYTPDDKRISLRAWEERGHVVFAVQDNGIGIPSAEQKRIFRRFYRVDRRLARDTAGVGLGLSIVHEIVRAHRGTVHVASSAGGGSTFSVRVPIDAGGAA